MRQTFVNIRQVIMSIKLCDAKYVLRSEIQSTMRWGLGGPPCV